MIKFLSKVKEKLSRDTILQRLSFGMFWMTFSTGVSKIFLLAAIVAVGRLLGKSGFGELSMIRDTCGMFGTFAGLGLGVTLVKFVAEMRNKESTEEYRKIVGGLFALGFMSIMVGAAILFLGADFLSVRMLNSPEIATSMRFGILLFVSSAGSSFMNNALIGMEMFRQMTLINIIEGIINLPAVLIGCYYGGLDGCVIGFSLATCLGFLWQRSEAKRSKESSKFFAETRKKSGDCFDVVLG